ncbi:MAG: 4-alpha-glucanotransferase [Isosphaeraceae bacterium]
MRLPRSSGILLHPTSLPGPFGIGDLGPSALEFLDLLSETGQRWWQILPVGPTGYGNSPYQSDSSYAGNPLLISPERLVEDGLLSSKDLERTTPVAPDDSIDFDAVVDFKTRLLRLAFRNFEPDETGFASFVEKNAAWLDDYALYMALKELHSGSAWYDWDARYLTRDPGMLAWASRERSPQMRYYQFVQYLFDRQWRALRAACRERKIGLIGDLPIFVAQDSADVWARPDLFWLEPDGHPTYIAGVPPDYFSATGQLWGNPLYRWSAHAAENFAWWISRLKAQTDRVDLLRLDHFRGFESYWEVPANSPTAESGRWAHGPGTSFFEAIRDSLGGLPLIAEDLGDITAEVLALRDRFDLPGMRVMQFGLNGAPGTEFHLPFSYVNHCIAYTGTHDNETTVGWFTSSPVGSPEEQALLKAQRAFALQVVGSTGEEVHWNVIHALLSSVADTVIIPLQDILGLDGSARMNVPGLAGGNWGWRLLPHQLQTVDRDRLARLTAVFARWNGTPPNR